MAPSRATCGRGFRGLSHAINMSVFCFHSTACCPDVPVVRVRSCSGEPQICKLTASRLMFFGGSCSCRFANPVSPYGGKTCRLRGAARADSAGRRRLFCSVRLGGWNVASAIDCVVAQVRWDFARGQGLYFHSTKEISIAGYVIPDAYPFSFQAYSPYTYM